MRSIDDYIDTAKQRAGLTSDRKLDLALGHTGQSVSHWRTKRAWPTDEKMVKLAELAGVDPEEALLDLSVWRTEGEARAVYERLARRISGTAAGIAAALLAGSLYVTDVKAEISPPPAAFEAPANVYYAQ